jgi:hypothetical protein
MMTLPSADSATEGADFPTAPVPANLFLRRPLSAGAGEHQRHASIFGKPAHNGDVAVSG